MSHAISAEGARSQVLARLMHLGGASAMKFRSGGAAVLGGGVVRLTRVFVGEG